MKWNSIRAILVIVATCLTAASHAHAAENDNGNGSDGNITGLSTFRYDYVGISGDRGRYREDNWRTDQSTGGLDRLHAETKEPDEWGRRWYLDGRALYDYDYLMSLLVEKEDNYYVRLDFEGHRRYYDGSNEYWNPRLYGLSRRFAELSDKDFYVDRRDYNIEFGLTPADDIEFIFGWHRQVKDGEEVLLSGGLARAAGQPDFRGIPPIQSVRSFSDLVYGEVAKTFDDKYNLRFRQEWEQFRVDNQRVEFGAFQSGLDYETFIDNPGFTNWRSMLMFDSFLDEETYVTANYMYDYLNNDGARDVFELPGDMPMFTNNRVGNSRRTNVGAAGFQRNNLVCPNLQLTGSVRYENSRTRSQSTGLDEGVDFAAMSRQQEVRVAENLRLTYDGIERTVFSFDADLEQRDINWDENNNGQRWRADIDFADQSYELKAVRRYDRTWKTTASYRYYDLFRDYNNLIDDTDGYPGFLGSFRYTGQDLTAKVDCRVNSVTNSTAMFQYIQQGITTGAGDKTQNLEIFRGTGSVSSSPVQNLFVVGSFMLENYRLNTSAVGDPDSEFAPGARPFDFRGTSYSILLDGSYALNEQTSCIFGYRHTEALGTVDYAGNYSFDKITVGLKQQLADNRHMTIGYEMLNFNNQQGGNFDDYTANAALVTYTMTF